MIDPLDSLAFSMHNAKGVYALLLGSGVSRSAGIPTGWEIIQDLVRQVAAVRGEPCEPNPEAWFLQAFGEQPNYSRLLDALGKTGAERQTILKRYIEPTQDERENGQKVPTTAHRAIAKLVASGHIKVILTTNFDRLLETALEAEGVSPTVIATTDAVKGATPLQHASCTIIKLHGDYLDSRIKNTLTELEEYDEGLNRLLDRVLDEYGIIVCGWSGDWDTALCAAIERCPNRRYTTYWAAMKELGEKAQGLIRFRQAQVIGGWNADTFFDKLAVKAESLGEYSRPHPLSTAMAIATLKRYLPDPVNRIRLAELVTNEVDRVVERLCDKTVFGNERPVNPVVEERVGQFEAISETVVALFAAGGYYGDAAQIGLWTGALGRLAAASEELIDREHLDWRLLRRYPALLALYAGGLGALAAGNLQIIKTLLVDVQVRGARGLPLPAVLALDANHVFSSDYSLGAADDVSTRIHTKLSSLFVSYTPTKLQYEALFDRFEYVRALVAIDIADRPGDGFLPGRLKRRRSRWEPNGIAEFEAEVAKASRQGMLWPGLLEGLFGGSDERFRKAREKISLYLQ